LILLNLVQIHKHIAASKFHSRENKIARFCAKIFRRASHKN